MGQEVVQSIFHHWNKIPSTHNLKENRYVLAHSFSLCLAGFKAATGWQRGTMEEKVLHYGSQEEPSEESDRE